MTCVGSRLSRRAALAALAGLAIGARAQAQAPAVGTIAKVSGGVTVVRQGQTLAATAGLALVRDDKITTGNAGRAEITGIDGSTLTIGPASQVALTSYVLEQSGVRSVLLELVEGILRFLTNPAPGGYDYRVRTPTAVASVRSTEWIVDANAGNTAVLAIEGSVEVESLRGNDVVLLTPGQGTDVRAGASPIAPTMWGAARVQGVLERTRAP